MLELLIQHDASDLHLKVGQLPTVRVHGHLTPIQGEQPLTQAGVQELLAPILDEAHLKRLETDLEVDFAYQYQTKARFRVNVFTQRGTTAAAIRLIPMKIRTLEELNVPSIAHEFTRYGMGLVLVTGPTGMGKSSTLAAMIEEINQTRAEHILTIEDPIEYVYQPVKSIISQREVEVDTHSWAGALRSALREDPNIVLVGEMRDLETISAALTVAETGHLVFATLHTNSGPETVDRIIDVFPQHQQGQIRMQLANVLRAVLSQRLIRTTSGDRRIPAIEIMMNTPAVSNLIREGKTFQIDNVMQTSGEAGMMPLESHLVQLINSGVIDYELARRYAIRPDDLDRLLGR